MGRLSTIRYALKRLIDNWKLVLVVFVGITIAAALVTGGPIYLKSLRRIGFAASIDSSSSAGLNILTTARDVQVVSEAIRGIERSVDDTAREHLGSIYQGHDRYLKTDDYLLDPAPIFADPMPALWW